MLNLHQLAAGREHRKGVTSARVNGCSSMGRATWGIPVSTTVCVGHEIREDAVCTFMTRPQYILFVSVISNIAAVTILSDAF